MCLGLVENLSRSFLSEIGVVNLAASFEIINVGHVKFDRDMIL